MLDPIHHTATYERVVEQIRRVIFLGRYLPGDKLPPERELAQQLGVSRTTVREAIRMLEGENLIRVKRGATGGIVVAAQGAARGADRVRLTTEQEEALRQIFEYRYAIECHAVRLAAERRTDEDLAKLAAAADEMDDLVSGGRTDQISVAEYNSSDTRFHLGIAEASRNPFFLRAVEEIRAAMFLPVGSIFERLSERANEHHRPILNAIIEKDADRAEEMMREHILDALKGLQRFLDT